MRTGRTLLLIVGWLFSPPVLAQSGLVGEYYTGTNFEHKVLTRVDPKIRFDWTGRKPVPGLGESYFSVRWTGKLLAPVSGKYDFSALVDDGIRVWVGNRKIIDAWALHNSDHFKGSVVLEAGKYYDLRVDYFNDLLGGVIDLVWCRPDEISKVPPLRDAAGKPVSDPTTYHTIDGQFLYRTVPPAPKPVAAVVPPRPAPRPVATVITQQVKPAVKPVDMPVAVRKSVAVPTPPPAATPAVPAKTSSAETFSALEAGKALLLQAVYFEQSTYVLLPESFPELDKLVRTLQQNPAVRISIVGHTDNVGDPRLNQALSEYRARVIMNYLTRHGIADDRVEATGYGGSRPLTTNATETDRARNRRVEFVVK